jgi:hypothetical protein
MNGCSYKIPNDSTTLSVASPMSMLPSKTYYFVSHVKMKKDFSFSSILVPETSTGTAGFFNDTPLQDYDKSLIVLVRNLIGSDMYSILLRNFPLSPYEINDFVLAIEKKGEDTKPIIRQVLISKGISSRDFFVFEQDLPCRLVKSYDDAILSLSGMISSQEKLKNITQLKKQFGEVNYHDGLLS